MVMGVSGRIHRHASLARAPRLASAKHRGGLPERLEAAGAVVLLATTDVCTTLCHCN